MGILRICLWLDEQGKLGARGLVQRCPARPTENTPRNPPGRPGGLREKALSRRSVSVFLNDGRFYAKPGRA